MSVGVKIMGTAGNTLIDQRFSNFLYQGAMTLNTPTKSGTINISKFVASYWWAFNITAFETRLGTSTYALGLPNSENVLACLIHRSNGVVTCYVYSKKPLTPAFTLYGFSTGIPASLATGPGLRIYRSNGTECVFDSRTKPLTPVARLGNAESFTGSVGSKYAVLAGNVASLFIAVPGPRDGNGYATLERYWYIQGVTIKGTTSITVSTPDKNFNYWSGGLRTDWILTKYIVNSDGYSGILTAKPLGTIKAIVVDVSDY